LENLTSLLVLPLATRWGPVDREGRNIGVMGRRVKGELRFIEQSSSKTVAPTYLGYCID
jgi:hypothetical protein